MRIEIKNNVISEKVERDIREIIKKEIKLRFTKLKPEESELIIKKIKRENSELKVEDNLLEKIVNNIYNTRIKNIIMNNYNNLKKNIKEIEKSINNNENILNLSLKYRNSPLNIIRVLFQLYYNKQTIKKLFNNPQSIDSKYKNIFNIAIKNDDYALVNQKEIADKAIEYEHKIEELLKKNDIKYKTQEELTEEQNKEYGKPIATPDFMIMSDLYINGNQINWIDVKNFYGENDKFILKSLLQQNERNNKMFGNGCFIFKLGFNQELINKFNLLVFSYEI
jgi:hypothetical protein